MTSKVTDIIARFRHWTTNADEVKGVQWYFFYSIDENLSAGSSIVPISERIGAILQKITNIYLIAACADDQHANTVKRRVKTIHRYLTCNDEFVLHLSLMTVMEVTRLNLNNDKFEYLFCT
jgi:hypothetical protein